MRRRSYIADNIVAEYNRELKWKEKARQQCFMTSCKECKYKYICDNEVDYEGDDDFEQY